MGMWASRIAAGPVQPGVQVERQRDIAGQREKIEKDAGVQQGFGTAVIDPLAELLLGLLAMMPPRHKGNPQVSRRSFTAARSSAMQRIERRSWRRRSVRCPDR